MAPKPTVLLIGDSIRMSYQDGVAQALRSSATVVFPQQNCRHSFAIRENLQDWAISRQPHLIHFNCGIHDLGWMEGETVPRFTVSTYKRNLRLIVQRLQAETDAVLIFANTTPFLNSMDQHLPRAECRLAPIVDRYNRAAEVVMRDQGVPVNDLYSSVIKAGPDACLSEDRLHMNDHGKQVLADAVAKTIKTSLKGL